VLSTEYGDGMSISAVVLTYNKWELTHQLLSDIRQYFPADEVLLVDNGSEDDEVYQGGKFWKKSKLIPTLRYVEIEENLGFSGGANYGLREATGTMKVLFSNDLRIYNRQAFDFIAECATRPDDKVLIGQTYYTGDTGWNKFGDTVYPYLSGHFLASNGWEELGYFDERYKPYDFEDVDLSTQAIKLGFEMLTIPERSIHHKSAGTIGYSPEREKVTRCNQRKFEAKWIP
jgi:GT2 family glycosyltransferase